MWQTSEVMTNEDHAVVSDLLQYGVRIWLGGNEGGEFNVFSYNYYMYITGIQEYFTECDLEEYDGIHELDHEKYVGYGYTLKSALECFKENNPEISDFMTGYRGDLDIENYVNYIVGKETALSAKEQRKNKEKTHARN